MLVHKLLVDTSKITPPPCACRKSFSDGLKPTFLHEDVAKVRC